MEKRTEGVGVGGRGWANCSAAEPVAEVVAALNGCLCRKGQTEQLDVSSETLLLWCCTLLIRERRVARFYVRMMVMYNPRVKRVCYHTRIPREAVRVQHRGPSDYITTPQREILRRKH